MEYYDTVPSELPVNIPEKWIPGTACPNCAADGEHGILLLLDMGADLDHEVSVSSWGSDRETRFEIVCSRWVDGEVCSFGAAPLDTVSATY